MEILDVIMRWVVAPILAVVLWMFRAQQRHETDIAVLKATMQANKEAHDREFVEIKSNFKIVFEKLDSIEKHLRK